MSQMVSFSDCKYCLLKIMRFCKNTWGIVCCRVMPKHKMMWFYGAGRNGKGRVIATLEAIVGGENCCYLELGELDGDHRFSVAQLYGKLVNVCSEPSTAIALQTALLKKITGEDSLDAEVKGKQKRISFRNVAKVFVLGNEFPKVNDSSVAFHERTLILRFPNSFKGKDQIDDIEQTWLKDPVEVSGIFNWMLRRSPSLKTKQRFLRQQEHPRNDAGIQTDLRSDGCLDGRQLRI